jgi:hypothetical protein
MSRLATFAAFGAVLLLACTTRTPLRELTPMEQREVGEAAVAQVCHFALDVESEITRDHEQARATALEYIGIASETAADGELSRSFSAETLSACGPGATEWGGVRAAIGQLVDRYGTDAERLEHLRRMSSPSMFCEMTRRADRFSRFRSVCDANYPATNRSTQH